MIVNVFIDCIYKNDEHFDTNQTHPVRSTNIILTILIGIRRIHKTYVSNKMIFVTYVLGRIIYSTIQQEQTRSYVTHTLKTLCWNVATVPIELETHDLFATNISNKQTYDETMFSI